MNHLAHFFLSKEENEEVSIGNFIADFISNKEVAAFSDNIQKGIKLHRAIDTFTDAHPVVKQSTRRLHPFHHKYAPVIVDVYYDFLLAKNWQKFAPPSVSIENFAENTYILLEKYCAIMPEKLQKRLPLMIADNFLIQYTSLEGLQNTFDRIGKYAAFQGNFGNASKHLNDFLTDFDNEFLVFFPELQQHVQHIVTA